MNNMDRTHTLLNEFGKAHEVEQIAGISPDQYQVPG